MSLHPCPLCGVQKATCVVTNIFTESHSDRWLLCCGHCGGAVAVTYRGIQNTDEAWNAAAAHAQGLRERIGELEAERDEYKENFYGAMRLAQRVPLTDEQMLACVRSIGLPIPMGLTRDVGPYEVTKPTYFLELLTRAIERALGIGQSEGGKR